MGLIVSSIAVGSMNKNNFLNSVPVEDSTNKCAIIASNVNSVHVDDWTTELAIIACNILASGGSYVHKCGEHLELLIIVPSNHSFSR